MSKSAEPANVVSINNKTQTANPVEKKPAKPLSTTLNGTATKTGATAAPAQKAATKASASKTAAASPQDAFGANWRDHIVAAKNNWSRLTEHELEQSAGVETKLTELVKERYVLTPDAANEQVKSFIKKCNS